MTIIDDLKAAGIECDKAIICALRPCCFGAGGTIDECPFTDCDDCDADELQTQGARALARLAIGYKGELDLLRAVIERVRYHEGDSFVDDMFAQVRMADGEQEATA